MALKITIIEDDPIMGLGMEHLLRSQGYEVSLITDGKEGMESVIKVQPDIVITDLRLPSLNGFDILKHIKDANAGIGVIVITGYAEVKDAVKAIRMGAFDYIAKPFSNDELLIAIEKYLNFSRLQREITHLKDSLREKVEFENIIGISKAMKNVFDYISSVADTDIPVLIRGESGTGKELVANAIHNLSRRRDRLFVKINCAAIPEGLFESEIFGHERGAFTGADRRRSGKFEFADKGTIFFDEMGEIPLNLQPKMLRVLEEGSITRLGDNTSIKVDVRCIFATKKDLKNAVSEGTFRDDLYYRINVMPITIPPLRDRIEDIPHLVEHFLRHFSAKFQKEGIVIAPSAFDVLMAYSYPGNVRELKHIIERAVVISKEGIITARELPEELTGLSASTPCISDELSLEQSLRCFEKQKILMALKETRGKKIEAARLLGITRKVLWKKLKDYDIDV